MIGISSRAYGLIAAAAAAFVLAAPFTQRTAGAASAITDYWPTRLNTAVRVLLLSTKTSANAVLLLPGGHGNLNLDSQGHIGWGEDDFVIRTREHYVDNGIAAIVPDVATDHKPPVSLDGFRTSEQHAADLGALSEHLHSMAPRIWMIAYDTGATSALNAIARGKADLADGLVLVSPVLEAPARGGTLLLDGAKRAMSRIPVLIISHAADGCSAPDVKRIKDAAAAIKPVNFQSIVVTGGTPDFMPRDPFAYPYGSCNTKPEHALAGLDGAVAGRIIEWIYHEGATAAAPAVARSDSAEPVAQPTATSALPELTTPGFSWFVARGLNVRALDAKPMAAGQAVLRLIATPGDDRHTLAVRVTGLAEGQTYRIAAWVKPVAGGNVELNAFDQPDAEKQLNNGQAVFDLDNHYVIEATGTTERGIEQHPDDWQKVWINLATSNGQFVVALRPAKGGAYVFDGDGRLGVILGGIEVQPPQ